MSFLPEINSLWRVPLILLWTAAMATVSVAFSLIDDTGKMQHGCARLWSRFIFFVSRVSVEINGLEQLDPNRGYIFAANHLSMFDHWAFLAYLPFQFRFAAKMSLFNLPFLGWHLHRSGNIVVDRTKHRKTLESFQAAGRKVKLGISFVIYPEGGRTRGEKVAPFKRGSLLLARNAGAPIVPVTIIGAHCRLRRGSMILHPGTFEMIIHQPMEFEEYKRLDLQTLANKVRHTIVGSYRQVS